MGEIAEMMLDGTLDSTTGEYLGRPCGYPRTMYFKKSYSKEEVIKLIVERTVGCLSSYSKEDPISLMEEWIKDCPKSEVIRLRSIPTERRAKIRFTLDNQLYFKQWLRNKFK